MVYDGPSHSHSHTHTHIWETAFRETDRVVDGLLVLLIDLHLGSC